MKITISVSIILLFGLLGYMAVSQAPPVVRLGSLLLSPTKAVHALGARELGQHMKGRSAAKRHLAFRHTDGKWQMANISAGQKKVDVQTNIRETLFLKRLPLNPKDRLQIGKTLFEIAAVSEETIAITNLNTGFTAKWEDDELVLEEPTPVYESGEPHTLYDEEFLFSIGGTINLDNQWAEPGISSRGAWIVRDQGRFLVAPGKECVVLLNKHGHETFSAFQEQWLPIDGPRGVVRRVVAGKTYYTVKSSLEGLKLIPTSKVDVFNPSEIVPPRNEGMTAEYVESSWIGSGKPITSWLAGHKILTAFAFISGLGLIVFIWHLKSYHEQRVHGSVYLSGFLAACLIIAFFAKNATDLACVLGICWTTWAWATWTLFANGRLSKAAGWLWICAMALAGIGVLLHLQLLAGADNTRWASYAGKQAFYVAVFGWLAGLAGNIPQSYIQGKLTNVANDNRFTRSVTGPLVLVYFFGLGLLFLMLIWGGEQGLGVFQPSELTKLLLVVFAAFTALDSLDLISGPTSAGRGRWRAIINAVSMTGIMVLFAFGTLLGVKDISPVLIILGFLLFWLWKIASMLSDSSNRKHTPAWMIKIVVTIVLLVIAVSGFLIHEYPQIWSWFELPQHDRIATWSDPHRHPSSGAQVIAAMRLVGHGRWIGGDGGWFGENSVGNDLPAVQDDFALAFLLYKFGGLVGLILLVVQFCYLYLLYGTGKKILNIDGNYGERQAVALISFIIHGLVVIHLLQWGISWGNTLGLLPVMGQPMTWLSSGNSHLLFIGMPTLILGLVSCWLVEDS